MVSLRAVLPLLLWLLATVSNVTSDGIDDEMEKLADNIGHSFTSISLAHDHKVDWMFVIDHGGFNQAALHLEYSKYFIQQLASHLYISPMYSQAGVVTYGASASTQIPLNVQNGNQCDFNKKVNGLTLSVGQSNLHQALQNAIFQLTSRGRGDAHKVTVLITTAGWENVGANPQANVVKAKNIGTLIVIVLVFDRAESIVAPVIMSFASARNPALKGSTKRLSLDQKYAFELEAKRGYLRRLYRHFLFATQQMDYLPLQVPAGYCPACPAHQACVCDVNLYDTYHCEKDTYAPVLNVGCPPDQSATTEVGQPSATIVWISAKAVDYSASMRSEAIATPELVSPYGNLRTRPAPWNITHTKYVSFIGKTQIIHRFKDAAQNSANCSFQITILDQEKPKIANCPVSMVTANTTGSATATVTWPTITSTDNSKVAPTPSLYINGVSQPTNTRLFSIGESTVRMIFNDQSRNSASCDFNVTVYDSEPPVVQQCDGPNSTIFSSTTQEYVDWTVPVFVDNSGLAVNISGDHKPGHFRIGKHVVTYTAVDVSGNSQTCSFTFIVRGYPCPVLPVPDNGAIICDNAVPGAACQIFCQNPFEFESIPGLPKLPEKYSCVGTGKWYPSDKVPHCAVRQGLFKKLTSSYYFDGNCSNSNVSQELKARAVNHYKGFVEGAYFKEAWGRQINSQDFNDPRCGIDATITTAYPAASTRIPTLPPARGFPTTTPAGSNPFGKK